MQLVPIRCDVPVVAHVKIPQKISKAHAKVELAVCQGPNGIFLQATCAHVLLLGEPMLGCFARSFCWYPSANGCIITTYQIQQIQETLVNGYNLQCFP